MTAVTGRLSGLHGLLADLVLAAPLWDLWEYLCNGYIRAHLLICKRRRGRRHRALAALCRRGVQSNGGAL